MTTHETDRPAADDASAENEAVGRDDPAVDQYDTPAGAGFSRADEAQDVEFEAVDADVEQEDGPGMRDSGDVDRAPEPDPVQRLAPVDPGAALDPGSGRYEDRWASIQAGFIDDPRRTVESASALVSEIWDETARTINDEREGVDGRWQSADSSTDDLRMAMQDYRALYARYERFTSD